jgi:glycosyltransferase involved in cell wall biosynthesis
MAIDVSIVITNYNHENIIEKAIASAIGQDYPEDRFEIVVVDDGSSDSSVKRISKYAQEHNERGIAFSLVEKENGGTASARNCGVLNSQGKYIGFLDGDDEYLPQKTELSVEALEFGPNIGIAYSDYVTKWNENEHSLTLKFPYSWDMLLNECIISTNSFITRKAWEDVGGFDEEIKIIEDYDLWLRICSKGFMARHIPTHLFIYNESPNNKTNTEKANGMKLFNRESKHIIERVMSGQYYV